MTWTYSGDPSSSPRNFVRFLIHDTDTTDQLFSDEEVDAILSEWDNDIYESARELAEVLIARFARIADNYSKNVGDISLSESYGDKVQHYKDLARSIMMRKMRKQVPTIWAKSDALVSTYKRTTTDYHTDFHSGMNDNPSNQQDSRRIE